MYTLFWIAVWRFFASIFSCDGLVDSQTTANFQTDSLLQRSRLARNRKTVLHQQGLLPGISQSSVQDRMQYWNLQTSKGNAQNAFQKKRNGKYFLFDIDNAGLNNIRLGWETAGIIALETGRTLVMPPKVPFYLIDWGATKLLDPNRKSQMSDFLNMQQLRDGLRVATFEEFRHRVKIPTILSDADVLRSLANRPDAVTITADACNLESYSTHDENIIYVSNNNRNASMGRLVACTDWQNIGDVRISSGVDLIHRDAFLRNHFVWHQEVFELAGPIIEHLGMYEYNALHYRFWDLQFRELNQPPSRIAQKYFDTEFGRSLFQNSTLYISTDKLSDNVIQAFRKVGIKTWWSKDFFESPDSPIAHLLESKGPVRVNQLKGPVEQLVCTFAKVFVGTKFSTFTGYINRLRINADAPQHNPQLLLYHTEELSKDMANSIQKDIAKWKATQGLIQNHPQQVDKHEQLGKGSANKHRNYKVWLAILAVPVLLWAATTVESIWIICVCYISASVAMNILNKMATVVFSATFLLVILQMLASDIIVTAIEFHKMKCGRYTDILRWSAVPFLFAGMLATSLWSFKEASLTAILIIRNILPIASFVAEKVLFNMPAKVSIGTVVALLVTLAGSLLYGMADASISNFGKIMILVNCLFTLADRLLQTQLLKRTPDFSISIPLCMVLNNTMGIIPLLILASATGEVHTWVFVLKDTGGTEWFWVVMSGCCGACLGYVGLKAQKIMSGTTILVIQNFNKILIIMLGTEFFGDRFSLLSCMGCIVSLVGCFWYGKLRIPAEVSSKAAEETLPVSEKKPAA